MEIFKTLIALVTNLFKKTDPKKFTPKPTETPPETRSKLPVVETKDPDVIEPESTAEIIEDNSVKITASHLYSLGVKSDNVKKYLVPLNDTIKKYNINTPLKVSHFLAQILHESGRLKFTLEGASGKDYEGDLRLGNTEPGDGPLFKGRGFIQITGRANYKSYGKYIGQDLISNPEKIREPELACDSAGWFWSIFKKDKTGKSLNDMAENDDFVRVTYFINGGHKGIEDRYALLKLAYRAFGVSDPIIRETKFKEYVKENITNTKRTAMQNSLFKEIPTLEILKKY